MKLKEEYNKTATLEMLKKILYEDETLSSRRTEISFDEIYDILSTSNDLYFPSTDANAFWKHFPTYQAQNMWYDKSGRDAYSAYMRKMSEAYNRGSYFHFDFNEGKATERMIINVTNQSSSLKLSQFLLSLQVQAPFTSKYQIPKFKTYLQGIITAEPLKNDKMVIYYERQHRDSIYGSIVQAAKQCKIISIDFSSTISGFYHLVTENDDTFPVGIAIEKNSTISFTDSCANSIFQQLTGINLFDESESAKENEEYEIKNTLEAEGIFIKVVEDCCKPFNK